MEDPAGETPDLEMAENRLQSAYTLGGREGVQAALRFADMTAEHVEATWEIPEGWTDNRLDSFNNLREETRRGLGS